MFIQPSQLYRAESATSTGHTIVIDEHYKVHTLSGSESHLVHSKDPLAVDESAVGTETKILSQAVDRLNWNEDYIIASAKASNGDESFMIIDRETVEATGYANKKDFKQGKKDKGIKISLKKKTAFDWY